jgi:hypothetical protein
MTVGDASHEGRQSEVSLTSAQASGPETSFTYRISLSLAYAQRDKIWPVMPVTGLFFLPIRHRRRNSLTVLICCFVVPKGSSCFRVLAPNGGSCDFRRTEHIIKVQVLKMTAQQASSLSSSLLTVRYMMETRNYGLSTCQLVNCVVRRLFGKGSNFEVCVSGGTLSLSWES